MSMEWSFPGSMQSLHNAICLQVVWCSAVQFHAKWRSEMIPKCRRKLTSVIWHSVQWNAEARHPATQGECTGAIFCCNARQREFLRPPSRMVDDCKNVWGTVWRGQWPNNINMHTSEGSVRNSDLVYGGTNMQNGFGSLTPLFRPSGRVSLHML